MVVRKSLSDVADTLFASHFSATCPRRSPDPFTQTSRIGTSSLCRVCKSLQWHRPRSGYATLSHRRGRCTRLILSGGSDRDGVERPRRSSSATTVQHHGIRVAELSHTRVSSVDRTDGGHTKSHSTSTTRFYWRTEAKIQKLAHNTKDENTVSEASDRRTSFSSVVSCSLEYDCLFGATMSTANGNELNISNPSSDSRESW